MMATRRKANKRGSQKAGKTPPKAKPHAPWPDDEARRQMSDELAERESQGKHSKNPDWTKKW
jgi:hypothetical protein